MQKPAAVIFDLGKVLLDFDYNKVAARMLPHCELSREEIIRAVNQSPLLHRYETGLLSSEAFFLEVKAVSRFGGEFDDFEPIFADIFSPIPEMIDLHTRLRQRGIRSFVFSNTNEIAVRHIRATYPFFANFSGYVFSYEHRSMKPEPGIYEVVERQVACPPGELLYIDDRLENVEQGAARGWQVIHHKSSQETVRRIERLVFA